MVFEVIGSIHNVETFARGSGIRELRMTRRMDEAGRWKEWKGIGKIRFPQGTIRLAELHWYEATRAERKESKLKRYLD